MRKKELDKIKDQLTTIDEFNIIEQMETINKELEDIKNNVELVALKPLAQIAQLDKAEADIKDLQDVIQKLKVDNRFDDMFSKDGIRGFSTKAVPKPDRIDVHGRDAH